MNKTAAFTSLTILLSVVQYGFSAQSLEELRLKEQVKIAREKYAQLLTPGRTRYQLEHVILPSCDTHEEKKMNFTLGARLVISLGEMAIHYKKITAALLGGPLAAAAAAITTPVVATAITTTVIELGGAKKHNVFTNRPCSTPILKIRGKIIDGKPISILGVVEETSKKTTYFNMKTGKEYSKKRGDEIPYLSLGGYERLNSLGEGNYTGGTQWADERKVHGKLKVSMATPVGEARPEIKIWKCDGICDKNPHLGCPADQCSQIIDTYPSPEGLELRSFAPSLCGQQVAFGFTNGAVGILHRNDTITTGEDWKWTDAFEQRVGTSLSQYIQDHLEVLRSGKLTRHETVDLGDKASIILLGGSLHPIAGVATAGLLAKVEHDEKKELEARKHQERE